ncbi:hypothetical protein QWZ08_17450 [Ferruginibacter paludis]|uniref:hypothetical protein n=1 Tax=Ferruginibacter paludis TaxID=1310417 RepID=UPI0025B32C09|nr:hypothetical protein [Ferruginibacter paludis]MDN3657442.1 hypothetical protein [Ferruginibacter paludis]
MQNTVKKSYANRPAHYPLMYKNRLIEKANIVTNGKGAFSVNVGAIASDNRKDAVLGIKGGSYQKLLRLPSLNTTPYNITAFINIFS